MSLLERDKKSIWHPFTPLKGSPEPLPLVRAEGVWLYTEDGRRILDAIASWWVNLHGHSHPYIAEAVAKQARTLEHVIFAGFTHEPAVRLAERLLQILPNGFSKVFYSDNGSTAVEVALKMAMQYWYNLGLKHKKKIVALDGAYHGDTFGAMSVGERSPFNAPFDDYLFDVEFLDFPACYQPFCCGGKKDKPQRCGQVAATLQRFEALAQTGEVAAFIYEPLVQGASGMRMYSPEILDQLLHIAQKHDIICIADEVMTGFGRTGRLFASEYCLHKPDIICLSKGLTGGTMALGVTACTERIIEPFRQEDIMKTFFHGHSFTANPLACAAANASLDLLLRPECMSRISAIAQAHLDFEARIRDHRRVRDVRCMGTIFALEIETEQQTHYFNEARHHLYNYFLDKGVLLRPLGNVVYVLPPYVITGEELQMAYAVIEEMLNEPAKTSDTTHNNAPGQQ
ncbi:adenosylmethionine--8-amino-7-oxononanoate transaminase [Thermonema rossianum]|uniref:adenosylmethionine--8-amino-7-oxononanoate transaminase n=1 Tax=Thermonema rossianum TaxID=55505 RepID=UPI00068F9DE4|nr:adenosylmethionine--8-amino-7-oxononanoate transaminase [Thermonema rossianum]